MKSFKINTVTAAMLLSFPLMSTSLYAADAKEKNAQEDEIEVIEVTGILGSLRRAEAVKLSAKNVVEAITAEDLGQFSDDSIAQALQRLPGVQVQEDTVGSRGDQVSIRGLGGNFVVATINGRSVWGAGTGEGKDLRSFNFNVVPSEVVSQVLVTKTPLANTVESGIGGAVDMQTLRPLDANYKDGRNWIGQLEARAEQVKIGDEDWGQRLSGAYIAKNAADNFGGYVAFNYSDIDSGKDRQQIRYRNDEKFYIDHNNDYVRDDNEYYEKSVTTLRDLSNAPDRNNAKKGALAAALQYQPTDNFNIVADVLYTRSENYNNRSNAKWDIGRAIDNRRDINGEKGQMMFGPDGVVLADGGPGDTEYHTTYMNLADIRCSIEQESRYNEDFENWPLGTQLNGMDCMPDSPGRFTSLREEYRNNFQESWVGGLNLEYIVGDWTVSGDLYYNKMSTEVTEVNVEGASHPWESPVALDIRSGYADFTYDAAELIPENIDARKIRLKQRINEGQQWGARLDFDYEIDLGALESVQFGVRYNTSTFDYIESQAPEWGYDPLLDDEHPDYEGDDGEDAYDGLNAPFTDAMHGLGYRDPVFGQYALPKLDLQSSIDYLDSIGLAGTKEYPQDYGPCDDIGTVGQYVNLDGRPGKMLTDNCLELPQTFAVDEDTLNFYVSGDFAFDIADFPVYATLGLRYVYTENTSAGVVSSTRVVDGDDEVYIPDVNDLTITKSNFSELLPSINVTVDLTDTLQLRLAASKSLSRPDLYDMAPRYELKLNDGEDTTGDLIEDCSSLGDCEVKKGNADLKPYTSWNYDVTFMWTMPTDGFLATSFYYKDISDFIFEDTTESTSIIGYEGVLFAVTQPLNASSATVSGFEIALHQPFTFLPEALEGFGMQLNFSYTDSSFESLSEDREEEFGSFGLPGASKNNANAVLYFERGDFSARVAYVYRDAYFNSYNGGASDTPNFYDEQTKISASVSYKINDMFKVKVSGSSLTEQDVREFSTYDDMLTRYTTNPRKLSVSLTAKF